MDAFEFSRTRGDDMSDVTEQRATVLVVDDDPLAREITSIALSFRYTVLLAGSIDEALQLVRARHVDVVVCDVMMPGRTGLDGCAELKAAAAPRYLPVLLLTALRSQDDRNVGLASGADDFLSKPVDRRELLLRVGTFTRLAQQESLIRQQVQQVKELSALKDDLVEVLVHDLRNPLSAAMSSLRLLKDSPTVIADDQEDVDIGLSATERMSSLLEELLQVRLLEEGKLVPHRSVVPLEAVVRNAVDTLRPRAIERRVDLALKPTTGDTTVDVDVSLLQRAIENLLSNAVKYTRQSVDVWIEQSTSFVSVAVADRGPGVPEPLRPRLFSKFASVEAEQGEQRRGIGLGLYMVRLVTSAHGGKVDVEPRDGGGSLFRLALARSA